MHALLSPSYEERLIGLLLDLATETAREQPAAHPKGAPRRAAWRVPEARAGLEHVHGVGPRAPRPRGRQLDPGGRRARREEGPACTLPLPRGSTRGRPAAHRERGFRCRRGLPGAEDPVHLQPCCAEGARLTFSQGWPLTSSTASSRPSATSPTCPPATSRPCAASVRATDQQGGPFSGALWMHLVPPLHCVPSCAASVAQSAFLCCLSSLLALMHATTETWRARVRGERAAAAALAPLVRPPQILRLSGGWLAVLCRRGGGPAEERGGGMGHHG